MRLKNKVAIVTGAGRGIGRATALLFAREGAKVVVNDVKRDLAEQTTKLIKENGGEATAFVGDVSKAADAKALADAPVQAYGRIDVLDNNAAIYIPTDIVELPEEDWDRVMNINVKGVYLCCKHVIPHMIRQGGGSIINIGSIVCFIALDGPKNIGSAYVASKGAVMQLTRTLAVRHARDHIRVNCVCPAFTETDMVQVALHGMDETQAGQDAIRSAGAAGHLLNRFGRPEEVAYAALFLASDESSFVTGSPLHVDGGYLAR